MRTSGNTILLTGGGSGIGRALARALHDRGDRVIVAGRREAALRETAEGRPGISWLTFDAADAGSIRALAERVEREHPDLDVLINNAGIMRGEDLAADPVDLEDAEAIVATNLLGPLRLTAALLPHLRSRPRAAVVNVSSGLAFVPLAHTPTYSATKAGLHSWTQSLRHQLQGTAVEVIEIAPPMVATDLMPGQAANPRSLPLDDFIAETMALLAQDPTPEEVLVERVGLLRRAEAEGRFEATFGQINGH
jgi:uncharacterized oxidoreductase